MGRWVVVDEKVFSTYEKGSLGNIPQRNKTRHIVIE